MKTWLLLFALIIPVFLSAQTEITLHTLSGSIHGTFQVPPSDHQIPVILIIAGSGPTDRNGNNTIMKNNCLKMLADSLQQHGFASLRYDKRGIAQSKEAGPSESDLRFENYIEDAAAWIRLLRKDSRFSKIIVAGHSEGSLIGMIAASREKANGFISIAGAGNSADIILKEQLSAQPDNIRKASYSIIDSLVNNRTVNKVDPSLYSLFRPSVQPYLISWFKYTPSREIRKLNIPILVIHGTTDIQVSIDDANLLAEASPAAKLVIVEGMNHILKDANEMREENLATYSDPSLPLSKVFTMELIRFLDQCR